MAGETVLIIEDRRENIVHLANNVLKPNGYQVITAMDGQRGLKRALAEKPDLIIMDLNMPKMDGLEVLSALQEREVDIPVILSTFYGSEQVAQQALRLGAAGYIVKPYTVGDMLKAIEKALANHIPSLAPAPVEPVQELAQPVRELDEPMPLTRQMERWMRDMNILTRVGKALVALLDLDRVCTRAVEAAIYVTRADHAFLFLRTKEKGAKLRLRSVRTPSDRRARLLNQSLYSEILLQVTYSGQAITKPAASSETDLTEIAGGSLGPVVAVPLRWQGEISGVLIATRSPNESLFSESDVEWLNGLAEYAAIAVRNAQAYQQHLSPPPPSPSIDKETLLALQREITQLGEELQAASQTAQSLATLLDQKL
jgi:two-component system NtrC family sensor kinase